MAHAPNVAYLNTASGIFHHNIYQVSKAHIAYLVLFSFIRKVKRWLSCMADMNSYVNKLAHCIV